MGLLKDLYGGSEEGSNKKIGVTYNPHNKEIKRAIIASSSKLDFIEVKNLEPTIVKHRILRKFPISMHVQYIHELDKNITLNLVSDEVKEILKDKNSSIYKLYDALNPFAVSFHLGFSSKKIGVEGIDNHNFAIDEVLSEEEVFKSIQESLDIIKDVLSERNYQGMILVENLDYHPTGAYEHVCKPEFISKIARNTGCGVLLDIAHAIISAYEFKMDVTDFVKRIGIDLIREVHVNSPLRKNGNWYDINEPFYSSEDAKKILKLILKESSSKDLYLNIECDKDVVRQIDYLVKKNI